MLERRYLGHIPKKPHTIFEYEGKKYTEWVITRDGFQGGFSLLYQPEAPTTLGMPQTFECDLQAFFGSYSPEKGLSRRHFQSQNMSAGKTWMTSRRGLMKSEHCRLSAVVGSMDGPAFCNAEADELYFIRSGNGELLTPFGKLPFSLGDYLLIPRGIIWKMQTESDLDALLIEGFPELGIPQDFLNPHGQLKLESPYTHRDFRSPQVLLTNEEADLLKEVVVMRQEGLTLHHYKNSPARTVGWDGSVYPVAFQMSLYQPKTGKIHLPPNLHLTFQGTGFVVCSFVPRKVDYMDGAIPCPYPHANVACDEVLYYVSGDFTSRKGVGPGSLSYHPYGIAHGPQPGQYFASIGQESTKEMAVMIDTWEPLSIAQQAYDVEDLNYPKSWTV
ncbi:MAG: homogentisate 1,2-dioxygenase [Oligoflexales bacterium]